MQASNIGSITQNNEQHIQPLFVQGEGPQEALDITQVATPALVVQALSVQPANVVVD